MNQAEKAAQLLFDVRLNGQRLAKLPDACYPADLSAAYAIQNKMVEKLLQRYGGQPVGYKIACTNEAAQKYLHLDSPFFGRLLSHALHENGAQLKTDNFFMRMIEPEFGFEMAQDLPPQPDPFTRDEVTAAIGNLIPAIEIVDSRYQDWTTVGAIQLIADQAVHGAWIMGEKVADWRALDLAAHQVKLWVNDNLYQVGRGEAVLGSPLNSVTWLANALRQQERGLKRGDLITSGVVVDELHNGRPGDVIKADFGVLGTVTASFS